MSPDEITRLARLHLVVNDDWQIFGLEAFARAIEQAATRKAIKRPEPGTTEYGSWINTAQKEACRCYFENEQSSRFKWLCAFEQALHRALLPDSKGER